MRRAGGVLEGGESFDSSGFSLAGQDEKGRAGKCDVGLARLGKAQDDQSRGCNLQLLKKIQA